VVLFVEDDTPALQWFTGVQSKQWSHAGIGSLYLREVNSMPAADAGSNAEPGE
jgi:hypothetical protein